MPPAFCTYRWTGSFPWVETYHGCTGGEDVCPEPTYAGAYIGHTVYVSCG